MWWHAIVLDLHKHVSLPEGHLSAGNADVSCDDGGLQHGSQAQSATLAVSNREMSTTQPARLTLGGLCQIGNKGSIFTICTPTSQHSQAMPPPAVEVRMQVDSSRQPYYRR